MEKLIIAVAPVGSWGKGRNNPITPEEIAEDVYKCYKAGASVVHLHVRDIEGNQTEDTNVFERTVNLIKERCDIIVEGSTGGLCDLDAEQRSTALNVPGIELATLNMGSVNFFGSVYVNSPDDIKYWAAKIKSKKVKPDFSIFETGMINNVLNLMKEGLVQEPLFFNFSLGFPGAMPATPNNLLFLMNLIPKGAPWIYVEHGAKNFRPIATAMALGGHVRVGFEDTQHLDENTIATSNCELVEKAVRLAREIGREIADVKEARRMMFGE